MTGAAAVASATNDGGVYSLVTWAFFGASLGSSFRQRRRRRPRADSLSLAVPLPACYALSLYTTMSSRKEIEHYLYSTPTPTTPSAVQHSQHRPPPHLASSPQPDLSLHNADYLTVAALATQPVSRSMGRVGVVRWSKEESGLIAPGEPDLPQGEVKAAASAEAHDLDGDPLDGACGEHDDDDSEEERQVVHTVPILA